MRFLHRLRPAPDRVEVDEFAVVFGRILCPDRLHRLDALFHQAVLRPLEVVHAVVSHLLDEPANPDADLDAAARDRVQGRDLLRRGNRVAHRQQQHREPEPETRRRGDGAEAYERVRDPMVAIRNLAAAREGRLAPHRDVRVLAHPDRLEAQALRVVCSLDRQHLGVPLVLHAQLHGRSGPRNVVNTSSI